MGTPRAPRSFDRSGERCRWFTSPVSLDSETGLAVGTARTVRLFTGMAVPTVLLSPLAEPVDDVASLNASRDVLQRHWIRSLLVEPEAMC